MNDALCEISVLIPAYNESQRIGRVLAELVATAQFEVIVIDDGSADDTAAVAAGFGVKVLRHTRNQGYVAAIRDGFRAATGQVCVTIDADGEMPLELIRQLAAPVLSGEADMVQGARSHGVRPSERLLSWIASLKGPVGDSGSGMRALRTDLARRLELRGDCICGVLTLEVLHLGGRVIDLPLELRKTSKPRRIAWWHLLQLRYLLPWLFRRS